MTSTPSYPIPSDAIQLIQTEDLLPAMSRWTSLGGLCLTSAIALAIGISAIARYNVAVKANAVVRPAGELRVVQAEMEGSIKQLVVKENQTIRKGEAIAYLEDSKLQTQKSQLHSNIQQNQLQLTQLEAQIRFIDRQLLAESDLMTRSITAAEAETRRNQRDYQERQMTVQADVQEAEVALDLVRDEWSRYQHLAAVGAISQQQAKAKEAAVHTAQVRLERAKATLNPSQAAVTIAQTGIAQQRARGQATAASLRREQEGLAQRQAELQAQVLRDQKEFLQIERDLQKTVIRATTDGTIFQLNLLNPNQVVRPGETIAQLAPVHTPLVVKAKVANQDIDNVVIGQIAQLRIEACPYSDYGTLKGTVLTVAPDAASPQTAAIVPLT
jgi:multidrug efflux pump subunit AcrA (membrane-fusion protein)